MSISVSSVNARGVRNVLKRKSLFLFCKGKGVEIYVVQETHACEEDEIFLEKSMGK